MTRQRHALRMLLSISAATACLALLVVDKGLGPDMTVVWAGYAVTVAVQALVLALPDGTSLRKRLGADRWTAAMITILILALAATWIVAVSGGPGARGAPGAAKAILTVQAMLISAGIVLRHLGSLLVRHMPAWAILPVTIGAVILSGTGLLLLDNAVAAGRSVRPLDALFMATSATCVTGLSVVDIGSTFTTFGQVVLLVLIQIGGLGLMSFAAFFTLFLGQRVGLGESVSISKALDSEFLSSLRSLLLSIMLWTLTIEVSGALVLYTTWRPLLPGLGADELAWQAAFHSVSAFCNAGLGLMPDNLESFAGSSATCVTIGSLIVLGGLGFGVLTAMAAWSFARVRGESGHRPPLQARLATRVTLILIALAMALVLLVEWDRPSFAGLSGVQRVSNAFLMAVTPRTAGFDTIPVRDLGYVVQLFFVALMFVGASPGGTGGGVKTTTLGLLVHGGISLLRQRPEPEMMHRRVPALDVQKAAVLLVGALLVCTFSSAALTISERASLEAGARGVFDFVFESVSAFGTVGLSTGVTQELTSSGRWIIILTMFIGRVGPATLAAVAARPRVLKYRYPEARVGIG